MNLKKVIAAAAALTLTLTAGASLSGCDSKGTAKYNIGICQLTQHDALDAATKGFTDAVEKELGKENVKIDLQNAGGDSNTCSTIVNQFVSSKVDLIMANATPALSAASTATGDIPIVATSITDYASALDMKDWNGKTGINVTGTSDLAPLAEQAAMIKELLPNAKKVGIVYCSSEANSKYQAVEVTKALKELGLEAKEYTFSDSNDIAQVVTKACDDSDALYVPTDNQLASNKTLVYSVLADKNMPVIAGEEGICAGCGVATLSIDYYTIGYKAGEMAAEILRDGKDPAEMEIITSDKLTKKYVAERCKALGITVPEGYEELAAQ